MVRGRPNITGKGDPKMLKILMPKSIRPPFAKYSHGVEVPAGKRLVI